MYLRGYCSRNVSEPEQSSWSFMQAPAALYISPSQRRNINLSPVPEGNNPSDGVGLEEKDIPLPNSHCPGPACSRIDRRPFAYVWHRCGMLAARGSLLTLLSFLGSSRVSPLWTRKCGWWWNSCLEVRPRPYKTNSYEGCLVWPRVELSSATGVWSDWSAVGIAWSLNFPECPNAKQSIFCRNFLFVSMYSCKYERT